MDQLVVYLVNQPGRLETTQSQTSDSLFSHLCFLLFLIPASVVYDRGDVNK